MTDLLASMQVILKQAGFRTQLLHIDSVELVCFEDTSLLGFGCVFESPDELLGNWRAIEDSLIRRFAVDFRKAADKSWNVYCVFLSRSGGSARENRRVRWIEEDLQHTRKVTGSDLRSREALMDALLPLLPLQNHAVVRPADVTKRLEARIASIAADAKAAVLDDTIPPEEIVHLLGRLA